MRFTAAILCLLAMAADGSVFRSRGSSFNFSKTVFREGDLGYAKSKMNWVRSRDRTSAAYQTRGGTADAYCQQVVESDDDTTTKPFCDCFVRRLPDDYNVLKVSMIRG